MSYRNLEVRKTYKQQWHKEDYELKKQFHLDRRGQHKKEQRQWFQNIKESLSCSKCGETHSSILCFHHRDMSQKVMNLSVMVHQGYGKERILGEIEKCDVLCHNCHRKEHIVCTD